jgi:hypothetical protein
MPKPIFERRFAAASSEPHFCCQQTLPMTICFATNNTKNRPNAAKCEVIPLEDCIFFCQFCLLEGQLTFLFFNFVLHLKIAEKCCIFLF